MRFKDAYLETDRGYKQTLMNIGGMSSHLQLESEEKVKPFDLSPAYSTNNVYLVPHVPQLHISTEDSQL